MDDFILIEPPPFNHLAIEALVGTKINDPSFYIRAFTHKSALKRYRGLSGSFETLEFMGDSVLGFVITKWLFERYEQQQEGFLTKARTKLVRGATLASIASKMGLQHLILMDEKGSRNGWNMNEKVLEDCFEALVGAIYLDLGILYAKNFVLRAFEKHVDLDECIHTDDNYKDRLMRYCQANRMELPEYPFSVSPGGHFTVTACLNGSSMGNGTGKSKKEAEQKAALHTLIQLKEYTPS